MFDVVACGEVLWDLINDEAHIGGAPFNMAAHAVRCGLRAALVSSVGDDERGRAAMAEIARLHVDARWVGVDAVHPTGTVTVTLQHGQPSYVIHEEVAWDHIDVADAERQQVSRPQPRALYFGTLAQRSAQTRQTVMRLIDACPSAVKFFDVNLRQTYWSVPIIEAGFARATLIKVNDDEARILGGALFHTATAPETFAQAVLAKYAAAVVIVTRGAAGCLVATREAVVHCPGIAVDVVDAVGAGDAFSAAFLAAWLGGENAVEAAKRGNMRGAWVASQRGAVPDEEGGRPTIQNTQPRL
ncbi:MAG: carbohydrate kinase [Clostridia bacterium]|nr:carbohydrate kinase [Clostridia bacterium]